MTGHKGEFMTKLACKLLYTGLLYIGLQASCLSEDFNMTEVADGLYVHQGKHLLPTVDDMDIANVSYIVGSRCVAVLDPGGSLQLGQALRQHIASVTDKPICYLILTHIHADHVLGAAAFEQDKPTVIGHELLYNALLENYEFFDEHFIPQDSALKAREMVAMPTLTIRAGEHLQIDIGDRILELSAYQPAHTNTDLVVFDRNTKTLMLSDLLFMDRIPPLDASLRGWIEVLEKLRSRQADRVIPGHGPVSASWPNAMQALQHYLYTLRDEVRAIIAAGGFLEDAVEKVGLQERDKWLLFDEVHKRNVTRAFAELEWE